MSILLDGKVAEGWPTSPVDSGGLYIFFKISNNALKTLGIYQLKQLNAFHIY